MKTVIIGGVAGGATAAARLRRLDESAEIVIFERSGYVSYATCGMPYYVGDIIEDKKVLTLQTPESFWNRFRIKVHVLHEVVKINKDNKTLTVKNIETGDIFEESYDKLIISTGARPVVPPIPGIDNDKIFTMRTIEDVFGIKEHLQSKNIQSAAVIGGGFIGVETAENLRELGIDVTMIEMQPQLLNILDYDMAAFVHSNMRNNGIKLILGSGVTAFEEKDEKLVLSCDNGSQLKVDMVMLSIGVAPETSLAKDAGLELGIRGSIVTNEHMETSTPDIYAIGDAVAIKHMVTGNKALISLAGPANKQGRIAADNICGISSIFKGSQGTSVLKVFDMTVAVTGINEKTAKELGYDYEKVILSPPSHATYYPGSGAMTIKLLYDKQSLHILGAQIVGYDGVDKRIDVIATAMQAGMTADRLQDLDLAYAPPYSSAKDPVNMAGCIIDNLIDGTIKQFYYEDVLSLQSRKDVILLDTRSSKEYERGHADGFINISVDDLRDNIDKLDKSKPVYVMCQSGLRSYIACRILIQKGFDCYNFTGGYRFYEAVSSDKQQAKSIYPCGVEIK